LYSNKKLVGASDHSEEENQGQGRPVTPKRAIFWRAVRKEAIGAKRTLAVGRWQRGTLQFFVSLKINRKNHLARKKSLNNRENRQFLK
jgi:3-oxoacyl-[acyl-carrier-protein] synthase III